MTDTSEAWKQANPYRSKRSRTEWEEGYRAAARGYALLSLSSISMAFQKGYYYYRSLREKEQQ